MRITLQIEDDIVDHLESLARRRSISLAATINQVLRLGLEAPSGASRFPRFYEKTFSMGTPCADLKKANMLAATVEDEDIISGVRPY